MQVTTGTIGSVSYAGRTIDGISFSGSGSLTMDATGQLFVPIFASMYGAYPYAGQVAGSLKLAPTGAMKVDGDVEWRKPDLTLWTTTSSKGTYLRGAIVSYRTATDATAFAATGTTGFTSNFKADTTRYSTRFVSSLWDTGTQFGFTTVTPVTASNYTGNILSTRGIVTEGLTGLVYSKTGGTISLNYLRNGRVNYGYGFMFPGGKVYGFLMVDDVAGSAAWTAQ
jgi:hypothetical protein